MTARREHAPPARRTDRVLPLRIAAAVLAVLVSGARSQDAPPLVFDHYHRAFEIDHWLHAVSRAHADSVALLEIGRSLRGAPIYAVEIHDPMDGPADEAPAFYCDGNIHGGELLGGEACLALIEFLLARPDENPAVGELLRTSSVYIVPVVNPDGREISLRAENHRWNMRPTDEDGDGLLDEDPPDDIDGDGQILQMRVPDPAGGWVVARDDARRMERRGNNPPDERPAYRLDPEGVDDDGDGRFNEDGVGGIDLNRNFPVNWTPTQFASGPFPLSEPESRALVEYITARPNIAAIHTFHTSGGMILRFPTLADQDWDYPEQDLADYDVIAQQGAAVTGYANFARDKRTIVELMHPGHGVFNDWASKQFGVLAITTEMWDSAFGRDALAWADRELGGTAFVPWHAVSHPQLGEVMLGGWKRFVRENPPPARMADEIERNVRWVFEFARRLPRVQVLESSVAPAGGTAGMTGVHDVELVVANVGWLPTATAYAESVQHSARPVVVELTTHNAERLDGDALTELGTLPGARGEGPRARTLHWQVRVLDGGAPAWVELVVRSQKAGTVRRRLALGSAQG